MTRIYIYLIRIKFPLNDDQPSHIGLVHIPHGNVVDCQLMGQHCCRFLDKARDHRLAKLLSQITRSQRKWFSLRNSIASLLQNGNYLRRIEVWAVYSAPKSIE